MSYVPYIILGVFGLIFLFIIGFLALVTLKKLFGRRKTEGDHTLESGDFDIVEKPGWFLYFRRRIAFYWNEFWYDRWLRVIRLREDRRLDFKNCLVKDKTVTFEDDTQYNIIASRITRHQGKSYYFVVEGKADFNPYEASQVMSDKDFYAKYNSARARELYLMTQYPVIKILMYLCLAILLMQLMTAATDFGLIESIESQKLNFMIREMKLGD